MSRRWILMVALLLAAGVAAFLGWRQRGPVVPAVVVQQAPLVRTLQFAARVATAARVEVGSTLTGRVASVAVRDGDQVKAGALLVQLEADELQAAWAQASANEEQAEARLAGLRSSGRLGAQAVVAQAQSVLVAASADLQRTRDLLAQGFVSAARLDEAQRAEAVARAQLEAARALRQANADSGSDAAQAQAQLRQAVAASNAARARLAQSRITAPTDGRVLQRAVEPGQIVQPGRMLLQLALNGPLELVASVDERYLNQLQLGQPAGVRADAYPGQRFDARVQRIGALVDAQRGAVEVRFGLPQPPAFVREDMTVSVELETARRPQALVLPLQAVRDASETGRAIVLLDRDGRVELRPVQLGLRTLDAVEVLDGVVAGDVVLLGPTLAAGQRVRSDPSTAAARSAVSQGPDAGSALTNAMGR